MEEGVSKPLPDSHKHRIMHENTQHTSYVCCIHNYKERRPRPKTPHPNNTIMQTQNEWDTWPGYPALRTGMVGLRSFMHVHVYR